MTQAKRVSIVSLKMVKEGSVLYRERKIRTPSDAVHLFRQFLGEDLPDREVFMVMCLDSKNCPNLLETASMGSLNAAIVHPRDVLKLAVLSNSAAIIVAHNHPSGDPEPSREDIEVTRRLADAGRVLGIELLDSVVIGQDDRYVSLKERGIIGNTYPGK